MKETNKVKLKEKVNKILFRRKTKYLVSDTAISSSVETNKYVATIAKNIESYGFYLDPKFILHISAFSKEEIVDFYRTLIELIKEKTGDDVDYTPMYPNFPEQIMEMNDFELFVNAIIHYATNGTLLPEYEKNNRVPLLESPDLIKIEMGTLSEDVVPIFKNLLGSKTSISMQDREDIYTIAEYLKELKPYSSKFIVSDYLPETIPLKENVALVGDILYNIFQCNDFKMISNYYTTSTDVLRLITLWSYGDISLAEETRYISFPRKQRRFIMNLLAEICNKNSSSTASNFFDYKEEWIRVGERLHPGEFTNVKYNKVNDIFQLIRNEKKPMFFSGAVEAAIKRKDINEAVYHLSKRPSEFARRLDQLLRIAEETNNEDKKIVLKAFKEYAKDVSVPVLIQVRQHFLTRKKNDIRVFYPKGSTAKVKYIKNNLPDISSSVCYEISKICENAICEQLRNKDSLGKVYIDPELQNYIVPFSQRSASSSTKTIVRGSRINIAESTNIIRSFIWWTNIENFRVDIDLSCSIYDDAWGYLSHISYTNLKSEKFNSYHSGDIVNGGSPTGKGVAEFVDIDINKVLSEGGRYVVFQVYSYSGYNFDKLKNCRFGWMERENADLGEIFEPSTVEMSMKLNSKSSSSVPVIFDCLERRYIWCDLPIESRYSSRRYYKPNNLENNLNKTTAICYSVVNTNKPDLFSLCRLNAFSRGVPVAKREEADVIFSLDTTVPMERVTEFDEKNNVFIEVEKPKQNVTIVTPFDIDYIMSNLL